MSYEINHLKADFRKKYNPRTAFGNPDLIQISDEINERIADEECQNG